MTNTHTHTGCDVTESSVGSCQSDLAISLAPIWSRLPCFRRWVHYVNCAQLSRGPIIWGLALPFTSGRTTPAGSLRQSEAENPTAFRLAENSPSLGTGLYWTYKQRFGSRVSVWIPNGRMNGVLFKHIGDISISSWHRQGLVEGECQEATGRTDLYILRSVFIL